MECAPDLEAEYSVAQQARLVAQEATYVTKEKFEKTVVGGCPNFGASDAPGAKFCAECGSKIDGSPKFCPECGVTSPIQGGRSATNGLW